MLHFFTLALRKSRMRSLYLIIGATLLLNVVRVPGVNAQTGNVVWSEPQNLSNSGAAENPIGFVDTDGQIHLIWVDTFAGWYSTQYANNQWSSPSLVDFPFERSIPTLHYASTGWVHAFVIDERRDLLVSRVLVNLFDDAGSWSDLRVIANPVVDYTVSIDEQGVVHLAYIQTEDDNAESAVLFYRQSRDQGGTWTEAQRLYETPYFRSLTRETANLQIASAEIETGEMVYVVFDNPARKQVMFIPSSDAGLTWAEPMEIDRPDQEEGQANPFGIRIGVHQNQVMLIWQSGNPESNCSQYSMVSTDNGVTWTERMQMLVDLTGCAQENAILTFKDQYALVASIMQGQVYLQVWDRSRWSDPFLQSEVSGFIDPLTLASVSLGCQQFFMVGEAQLFLAGCDTADYGDIWVTRREISVLADWFPAPSIWSAPNLISSSSVAINDLNSTIDAPGRVHLVWSHSESTVNNPNASAISYVQFDNEAWSQTVSVLKSESGTAAQPVLAVEEFDRILVGWSDNKPGNLYFNSVDAAGAVTTSRWVDTVTIPLPHPIAYSPVIHVDRLGKITIAYAIPLNEDRGLYITQSEDGGNTWSEPIQVFNATGAGWDRVGKLSLAVTADGGVHLLWWRAPLTSDSSAIELYFSNSEDGGLTWSSPVILAFQTSIWSTLIATGEKTLHAFWQETSTLGPGLKHQYSIDGGKTWSQTNDVSRIGELPGLVSVVTDRFAQVHILRVLDEADTGKLILQHLRWDGSSWFNETNLDLPTVNLHEVTGLVANATSQDRLVVTYSTYEDLIIPPSGARDRSQTDTIVPVYNLYSVIRNLDLPSVLPTPLPERTPLPTSEPTPAATPTIYIEPSLTPAGGNSNPPAPTATGGSAGIGILIGVGLSITLVVVAFSAWFLRRRPGRNY